MHCLQNVMSAPTASAAHKLEFESLSVAESLELITFIIFVAAIRFASFLLKPIPVLWNCATLHRIVNSLL